jgi:hypothetical protein
MDSLTTAYLVCMLIGSISAVGGAFAGNKMFPIESSEVSQQSISPPKVEPEVSVTPPQNTVQTPQVVSSAVQ